jgi:eukaryotic-like serine/threonine-protein kinase
MSANVPRPNIAETFTMPFDVGDVVGAKYEVLRLIGVGNIGFVVSAFRMDLGDEVALKFLRPEYANHPDLVARFAREARYSVRIKSEHVARVFDVGKLDDGTPFIVMERLEGRDLSRVLTERGRLPAEVAVEYVLQACEALATAHANGIVHRDIKPENLFLTRAQNGSDVVKVLDFGISKVALTGPFDNTVPLVRTLAALGSPVYMSPEQIRASKDLDARSDIWALGCLLYELLGGVAAFDAPSIMQICAMILERNPVPLRTVNSEIDPALEAVVMRCLEKDQQQRFRTVADLAVALAEFGPEHARVWAERSQYVLKSAEATAAASADDDVPRPSLNGSSDGVSISIGPSTISDIPDPDISAFKPRLGWKSGAVAFLVGGALAGIVAIRMNSDGSSSPERASKDRREPLPTATATSIMPTAAPPPPILEVPAAAPVPNDPPPALSVTPVRAMPRPVVRKSPPPPPKPPTRDKPLPAQSAHPQPVESEPDVGF